METFFTGNKHYAANAVDWA